MSTNARREENRTRIHRILTLEELEPRVAPSAVPPGDFGAFDVIVEPGLLGSIQPSLDVYAADLTSEGYAVSVYEFSGTAQELRTQLASRHASDGLAGALLVGDLPYQIFKSLDYWDGAQVLESYPHDLYFMDLDGAYVFNGPDRADAHTGDVAPEIYISRITTENIFEITGRDEATLINDYFAKVHAYREGLLTFYDGGVVFADDNWRGYNGSAMSGLYSDVLTINDPSQTTKINYLSTLTLDRESILECIHSSARAHYIYGPGWGNVTSAEVVAANPRQGFYNMFNCSSMDFSTDRFLGGAYVYGGDYGLNAVGSTKAGSMLDFSQYYIPQGLGASVGEAFQSWFESHARATTGTSVGYEVSWFYGMTMQGDPTLRPSMMGDRIAPEMTVVLDPSDDTGLSNSDGITSNAQPTYLVTVNKGGTIRIDWNGDGSDDVISAVVRGGTYQYSPDAPFSDGSYAVDLEFTDGADETVSAGCPTTIDTQAPAAPLAPDLDAASDTGLVDDDNITGDLTPTFHVAGSGPYVRIYRDGSLCSGPWETDPVTLSVQSFGAHCYTARAVDAAGNESGDSPDLIVTIDRALMTPIVMNAANPTIRFHDSDNDWIQVIFCGDGEAWIASENGDAPTDGADIGYIGLSGSTGRSIFMARDMNPKAGGNTLVLGTIETMGGEPMGMVRLMEPLGTVQNTTVNIGGALKMFQVLGAVNNLDLSVGGDASRIMMMGGMTGGVITVTGRAMMVMVRNGMTDSALNLNGGVDILMLSGGLDNADIAATGDVLRCIIRDGMRNGSAIQISGATSLLQIIGGVASGSTLDIAGNVSRAMIFGPMGGDGVDATSTAIFGSLSTMLMVKGNLAGTVDIQGSCVANGRNALLQVIGNLTGDLVADLFGNVMVIGNFTGAIGDADTAAGTGNYLVVKGANDGTLNPNDSIFALIR
ncbi:MAG: Ig-like domain-containing protein [Planctomycetota bacterium]